MKFPKQWFAILFGLLLFLFTGYLLADTFLIPRAYAVVSTEAAAEPAETSDPIAIAVDAVEPDEPEEADPAEPEVTEAPTQETVVTETSYSDGNISVTLTTYRYLDTDVYVADVTLTDADYLKTAFAENTYGRNITQKTSAMADSVDAILAINGDYYGAQEKGYVIRNGIVYRSTARGADVLCIYADGTMKVVNDRDYTAEELVENGVWQAFSFGPGLVESGSVCVDENDEVGRAKASNPRTAIGLIDANHFVFVVSDGRTDESEGLSLYELATFMQGLGVKEAYNLDGGGSSTMYFNGEVINNPTSNGKIKEREVSDIVYIGY